MTKTLKSNNAFQSCYVKILDEDFLTLIENVMKLARMVLEVVSCASRC